MKKYQLTELANTLVQAEEFFDVNITSPDQIDILEKHFGKIGDGTEYKRDSAVTFSYYSSMSNALYTITDPDTPRYEFSDLLECVNVDSYYLRDEGQVGYVSVGEYMELNQIMDYLFPLKWLGLAEVDTSNLPLYLKVTPEKVQWSNTPFTNVLSYTPVHEFINKNRGGEEALPDTSVADFILQHKDDEELHRNSKYTLTGNGITIEIKGKLTITGPEGTWTIGK